MQSFGLMAQRPIHWLLANELDVKRHVQAFAADRATATFSVAGPPPVEEMIRARNNPCKPIELPMVKLHLRKVKHHLTGEPGIEVKCSDADMDKIVQWARQSVLRKALANNRPLLT